VEAAGDIVLTQVWQVGGHTQVWQVGGHTQMWRDCGCSQQLGRRQYSVSLACCGGPCCSRLSACMRAAYSQTAMAIRLDAPSFSSSGVGQSSSTTSSSTTSTQRVGGSRSDALSATMDAALGYLSLAQQQPSGLEQNSTSHIADTTTSAARAMLQKAARSFAAGTAALQSRSSSSTSSALSASLSSQLPAAGSGSSGHSAYQRQIGASLARLRLMHVLEDCTSGEREVVHMMQHDE
jgi:hypothetical protein